MGELENCRDRIVAVIWSWRYPVIRSVILCPDAEMAAHLERALNDSGEVTVTRVLHAYASPSELMRSLRAHAPDVVFLSFESIAGAQDVVRCLEKEAQGVQIIGIHGALDANVLKESMRLGVREFLFDPFERASLMESLHNVAAILERNPPGFDSTTQIFSFLPSKAGVGTSTLALNVSHALSRRPDSRVLLSDFDLNSGMMRFLLKLKNTYSVLDSVENSMRMDENLWPQLVTQIENLDVLHAGPINPSLRIEPTQIRHLIQFMRRNYQVLCFDLSGNLERYSLEIMQESRRILMVCTPEIPSLHLAREKMNFLRTVDLESRVGVVLNRVQKRPLLSTKQVEEILRTKVIATIPNDYEGVNQATAGATFVKAGTELAKHYDQFANELVESRPPVAPSKKKFLDYFSVTEAQPVRR
jgi:pilus assembly protein CpaE